MGTTRIDTYTHLTAKILAASRKKGLRWDNRWVGGELDPPQHPLRWNRQPYSNPANIRMLYQAARKYAYCSPIWMTPRQALKLGGTLIKGENGIPVRCAGTMVEVFNAGQVDGLPAQFNTWDDPSFNINPDGRIAKVEGYLTATGVELRHGRHSAFFSRPHGFIQMPYFSHFVDAEAYYATLAYHLIQWARHGSRLNLSFHDNPVYGVNLELREWLVAELGAAYLCFDLGISTQPREDHAAYIAYLIQMLGEGASFITAAINYAAQAVHYLHGLAAYRAGR